MHSTTEENEQSGMSSFAMESSFAPKLDFAHGAIEVNNLSRLGFGMHSAPFFTQFAPQAQPKPK